MNAITKNIPNAITCINIAAGCMAVICATHGISPLWGMKGFEWAFIFVAIGAVADFLDGFAARLLHAYSDLGKELDSLCDLVTFGVAPALTMFFLLDEIVYAPWMKWLCLLIPISGALRLARFNIDTRQATEFIGLPIPANAIFWIGYASLMYSGVTFLGWWYVFLPILLVECWLMNSPIRMFSLKMTTWSMRDRANVLRYLLIVAAAVMCFTLGVGGLLWVIVFYVLLSLTSKS